MQDLTERSVYREDHEQFREQARRFFEREIVPHHAEWERQGIVPKEVWRKAGREGLLNPMLPEPYGGGGDFGHAAVLLEEIARTRSEEHTSELQSQSNLVCRLLLEKKKREDK